MLEPKLVTVLREGYSREQFLADLSAGVTVGVVALPLAIAFAIASGVKPEQGLYTAVVAGFVIAVLGGTRAQISGPTGAFIDTPRRPTIMRSASSSRPSCSSRECLT